MNKLKRPAVLVTGGARRIGKAVALDLASGGFDIALHYNASGADAFKTAALVRAVGVDCEVFAADLSNKVEAGALLGAVVKRFSRLAVLVNSASVFLPSGISRKSADLLEQHWKVHVSAPWLLSAEFARLVRSGCIVNFLDSKVSASRTDFAAYLLSKKALWAFTGMAAAAFAPAVRVNAVAPGLILPPQGKGASYLLSRARKIPLKRPGTVKNVLDTVRFLINNDYVTGQTIFVDGGDSLK